MRVSLSHQAAANSTRGGNGIPRHVLVANKHQHSAIPPIGAREVRHILIRGKMRCTAFQEAKEHAPPSATEKAPCTKDGIKSGVELARNIALDKTVLFQAFGWDSCGKGKWYKHLETLIPDMKEIGVTHVWLPPPSQSVSKQGYLPGQLYNLNSAYGTKDDLYSLCAALRSAGLVPVADIVINHRCADEQDERGRWNKFRDDVDHLGNKIDWGQWAITGDDPEFGGQGNPDTGADYGPAPDLDHMNPHLRACLIDWLIFLRDYIGFGGWRFDFVKGYAARYTNEYCQETVGSVFNVGEYWVDMSWEGSELKANQDRARQTLCDWLDEAKQSSLFDFPTKGILQYAVQHKQYWRLKDNKGKAPGLLGWWPAKAVTFVDNHDTGSTQQHWPFPASHVALGYAYIFTHPGNPCVLLDHLGPHKETLALLAALRERQGIGASSKLDIQCAEDDMYFAVVDGKVAIKLGPRYDMGKHLPRKEDGWIKVATGKDFAVWEKQ